MNPLRVRPAISGCSGSFPVAWSPERIGMFAIAACAWRMDSSPEPAFEHAEAAREEHLMSGAAQREAHSAVA